MQVVINAAYLPAIYSEEYASILSTSFGLIAIQHPEHNFIFVCSLQFKEKQPASANIKFHIVTIRSTSVLKKKYWFDISLPRILKNHKADIFITPVFCSVNTPVPQCLLMHLPDINNYPALYSGLQSAFYKKYTSLFVKNAAGIIAMSMCAEKNITAVYPASLNKISVTFPVVPGIYKPADDTIAEAVKNKYTAGKEYFLYGGSTHPSANLHLLLKAFSLFKKRQQSSMKLVIVSLSLPADLSFIKSIDTYKYRNDIVLLRNSSGEEYAEILAAAYAFVYPVIYNGLCFRVLQALQAHVPVIVSRSDLTTELAGNPALFVNPASEQDIADKLMRIYKDENLRNELKLQAAAIAATNRPQASSEKLWSAVLKTVASSS